MSTPTIGESNSHESVPIDTGAMRLASARSRVAPRSRAVALAQAAPPKVDQPAPACPCSASSRACDATGSGLPRLRRHHPRRRAPRRRGTAVDAAGGARARARSPRFRLRPLRPTGRRATRSGRSGDFTWLNGTNRQTKALLDSEMFTGSFLLDVNYTASTNSPIDNTVVGSTSLLSAQQRDHARRFLGFGGGLSLQERSRAPHDRSSGSVRSSSTCRATTSSTYRGQFDLQNAPPVPQRSQRRLPLRRDARHQHAMPASSCRTSASSRTTPSRTGCTCRRSRRTTPQGSFSTACASRSLPRPRQRSRS